MLGAEMPQRAEPFDAVMRPLLLALLLAAPLSASELSFNVVGIDCSLCAKPVVNALSSVNGVQNVRLDWKKAVARVDVPEGFDRNQIRTALNNAGFEVVFPGETAKGIEPLPADVVKKLDIIAYPGTSKVEFSQIVAAGKVTIVDFYADWCGPCHVLEARIEHLMQGKPNLALRRVNIGKWDNEAAKQATREFRAEALPYIRLYDGKGNFVTAVTGGMWDEVLAAIARAEAR
jgi:thiol-disulfide isomerase/thioredoxin